VLIVRVLVNGDDPADLAAVAKIQDGFSLEAVSAEQFVLPDYDETSFAAVRHALLAEAQAGALSDASKAFGTKEAVDPHIHLIGTAAGWGGMPARPAGFGSASRRCQLAARRGLRRSRPVPRDARDDRWSMRSPAEDPCPRCRSTSSISKVSERPQCPRVSISLPVSAFGDPRVGDLGDGPLRPTRG